MLKELISKEIYSNFSNLRFIVGIVLCVIVTMFSIVVLTHDYKKELEDYNLRISIQDEFISKYFHTNRTGHMNPQKPPEMFHPLITGIHRDTGLNSFDDNPLSALFPTIDFLFIVTIIVSLLAIVFSYDAVSGEREQGTLKLMLSNSHSRSIFLFSKWIGGIISILIPFVLSLLLGVLYISIHPSIHWDISTWASLGLIFTVSIIYISAFFLIGLMVSASTQVSSVSILVSISIWIMFTLIVPNITPYISAQLYSIPSVNKIEREVNRLGDIERDELGRKLSGEVIERFKENYGSLFIKLLSMRQDEVRQRTKTDPEFKAMQEAYRKEYDNAWDEANRIQREKIIKIREELNIKSARQNKIAKNLACLSPYANFVYIATDLSGTGLHSIEYFSRFSGQYYKTLREYLGEKAKEAMQKDPTFNSNTFLNISDRPRFSFKEEPLKNRIIVILPYLGVLLFFNVLFFSIAFVKFLKYDVR